MKTTLIIALVLVAAFGASEKIASIEADKIAAAEIEQLAADLEAVEKDAARLREALAESAEALKLAQAKQQAPAPVIVAPDPAPVEIVASEPQEAAPEPTADDKAQERQAALDAAQREYEAAQAEINRKRVILETNLATGNANRRTMERNSPEFAEQSVRRDASGAVIGNRGVRTSAADREKAMIGYRAELAKVDAYIAAVEAELLKLNAEQTDLEKHYADITKIR